MIQSLPSLISGQETVIATKLGLAQTPYRSIQLDYRMQQTILVRSPLLQAISREISLQ